MAQIKVAASLQAKPVEKKPKIKSGTAYPYYNLDDSVAVAVAVHSKGGGQCSQDQLASFLGYSTTRSGAFLQRLSAAKLFGLVNVDKDRITLTERARKILSPVFPEEVTEGRIEAFLAVPLFNGVYEQFRGRGLAPEVGMKNLLETHFKIVKDRLAAAYRVLMESAEQAGFFLTSGDQSRLIRPLIQAGESSSASRKVGSEQEPKSKKSEAEPPFRGGGDGEGPPVIHPALVGLLRELPRPGNPWPQPSKDRFKAAFESLLDVIYPAETSKD